LVVLYSHNYAAAISGHYQESSDCFEYPKNPYLNQATPKKYLKNVPTQKKSRNQKFQTQKSPSIIDPLGFLRLPAGEQSNSPFLKL